MLSSLDIVLEVLGFKNKNQRDAFKELLKITDCFFKEGEQFISSFEILDALVKATQNTWRRKAETERWDLNDSGTMLNDRRKFFNLFNRLGLLAEKNPRLENYGYALLLGALQPRVEIRVDYLASLWEGGVCFNQIVLLGGQRPLVEEQEPIIRSLEDKTEISMMQAVIEARQRDWPKELSEIEVISVSAPLHKDGSRPDTRDTVDTWISAESPQPGDVLAISNQPYVDYQNAVIRNVLPLEFTLDTVGCEANSEEKISVVLDAIARRLFADYPRAKKDIEVYFARHCLEENE